MTGPHLPVPRRVFIVGSDKFDSVADSYRRTLRGHYEVELFNPEELIPSRFNPWGRQRPTRMTAALDLFSRALLGDPLALTSGRLRRAVARFAPDLILTTAIESLNPQLISDMRADNPGAKLIGVFSDAIVNFARGYFFVADYDALFFKDHYIVDKLRAKLGWRRVFYLPQACDPTLHHKIALRAEDYEHYGCDITLAGNVHCFRAAQLEPLLERDLRIWGDAVPRWLRHPIRAKCVPVYVAGEDKCRAMLASKIVLNANHYAEIAGTNKRTFEVAAIGAFQLTDAPALADVFIPDVEVATFDTRADMLEKIDHYLARPELRMEMAEKAHVRAHREHTYAHRWVAKMEAIGCGVPESFPIAASALSVHAA